MKLPNGERAFVPPEKLAGYLLSETHPTGQSKARFIGTIVAPDGRQAVIRTVWIVEPGVDRPRFVTAYPA